MDETNIFTKEYIQEHWLSLLIDVSLIILITVRLLKALRGSLGFNILIGLITVYALWWLFKLLNMHLISSILGEFTKVGVLAVLIVFQLEIRKFLMLLGGNSIGKANGNWKNVLPWNWNLREGNINNNFEAIASACESLASTYTGALLVFPKSTELKFFAMTGEIMDAVVSKRLIESIFNKTSPLHDGAAIIHSNRIKAAGCVLPVSENPELPPSMGLRHRAAVGITEQSDAIAIVVSEETGRISLVKEGKVTENINPFELMHTLSHEFSEELLK
jgi:diadenylate cyclase